MRAEAVGLAPVWHTFYGLLLVMLTMQLVVKVLALRDGGRVLMKAVDFLANGIGIVALALLAFAGQIFVATSAGLDAQKLADVNHGVSLALRIALLFAAFGFVSEIWKYVRGRVHLRRQLAV
jgi:fumarate reductase subunit C